MVKERNLTYISLAILLVLSLTILACSLGAPRSSGQPPAEKATEPAKLAPPASTGGESGDAAAVLAKLPAPPQSRAITLGDLPKDTGDAYKMMFSLDGSEPMFWSDATPLDVIEFYADELSKYGYSNPFLAAMIDQGKLISPYLDFFKEDSKGMIRVFAGADETTGKTLVFLKVVQ